MRTKRLLNLISDRLHTLPLLVLYLTDGCNSRCITCDIWRSPRRNMRWELVEKLAGSFKSLHTRGVLLSGGEAMQHPRWPEIAWRFRSEGATVMLLTNGLLLRKQAEGVIASVDEVIVSLDGGTAATYAAIRGVDGFDLVLDGIRAVRAGGVPVITRTTVQRANYREIPQIIEVAQAADVNRVSFLAVDVSSVHAFGPRFDPTLVPAGELPASAIVTLGPGSPPEHGPAAAALMLDDVTIFRQVIEDVIARFSDAFAGGLMAESPAKLRRLADYFAALNGAADFPRPRCNAPHISAVVEVDGTLRPCYFLPGVGRIEADEADTTPVLETLNSPEALALRLAYRSGQRPECERCVCPLYKGPRALLRMS
ncbi:MAG: radical SAM protein [Chloroflexi bacterium]|nr:radical SAM protein [Chloroflexota bacterium]